jgi:hypothetical protein
MRALCDQYFISLLDNRGRDNKMRDGGLLRARWQVVLAAVRVRQTLPA